MTTFVGVRERPTAPGRRAFVGLTVIRVPVDFLRAVVAAGKEAEAVAWMLLQVAAPGARGYVDVGRAAGVAQSLQLDLDAGAPFWTVERGRVYLRSAPKIARALGARSWSPARRVAVELAQLEAGPAEALRAALMAGLNPAERAALASLEGVGCSTR